MESKLKCLRENLRQRAPLVIAYSGGVDSAFLLAVAQEILGDHCLAVIADSPSLPRQGLADARQLAHNIGAKVEVIETGELHDPNYAKNPINRCYFCKAELFTKLDALAQARGFRAIAYGENADDAAQFRPGRLAAAEFQVIAPLKDAGLSKVEIRNLSRTRGLPTADAPAQPCLSSRIPHGTPVTAAALAMIERGEALVRQLGFRVFRVRHHLDGAAIRARVEIAETEMPKLAVLETAISEGLRQIGYDCVEIDPRGYGAVAS